jgi:hypothetical protein
VGAYKPTTDGRWVHLACAQWMPGLEIRDTRRMEPVAGLDRVPRELFNIVCSAASLHKVLTERNQVCSLCGYRAGACLTCASKGCTATFHITCAHANNLYMERTHSATPAIYCRKHSDNVCSFRQTRSAKWQLMEDVTFSGSKKSCGRRFATAPSWKTRWASRRCRSGRSCRGLLWSASLNTGCCKSLPLFSL